MGDSLGDVAHVERGEGRWLRDCAVELVLALLDDGLEVFEDVEVAFPGGQGLEELLLCGEVVGHGEGGREAHGGLLGGEGDEKRGIGVLRERGDGAFAVVEVDVSPSHSFHPATQRWDSSPPPDHLLPAIFPLTLVAPLVSYFRLSCLRAHHSSAVRWQTSGLVSNRCILRGHLSLPSEPIHTPTVTAWAPVFTQMFTLPTIVGDLLVREWCLNDQRIRHVS